MSEEKIILVIDDDPDILDSVKAILSSSGFKVVTAATGKEGLGLLEKNYPDVVLVDMMMETIDAGSKVARKIKESDPKLPVYLLSSIGSATEANIEIDKLGFNGVFQKPVDPDNLISSIKRTLGL